MLMQAEVVMAADTDVDMVAAAVADCVILVDTTVIVGAMEDVDILEEFVAIKSQGIKMKLHLKTR